MGYQYDVFLSYCHETGVKNWVQTHFEPQLHEKLSEELPTAPKIFIDHQMPTGVLWKETIEDALARSKLLVCIWNPPYFRSKWCQSEWQTILAREQSVGMPPGDSGLLYSIVYGDGDFFPDEAEARQNVKFHQFACTANAFRESALYIEFELGIAEIARDIVQRLKNTPPWDESWRVTDPDEVTLIPPKPLNEMPRI